MSPAPPPPSPPPPPPTQTTWIWTSKGPVAVATPVPGTPGLPLPPRSYHITYAYTWQLAGEYTSTGIPQEVLFGTGCEACEIEIIEGTMAIGTILIRNGGFLRTVSLNGIYRTGDRISVPIDKGTTGIRIQCTAGARYRVIVR